MTTFIEINKINSHGEHGKALVRVSDIVGIKEKHTEPVKTYNEDGTVATETPRDKDFQVLVVNGCHTEKYHVDETEYNRIVAELLKE